MHNNEQAIRDLLLWLFTTEGPAGLRIDGDANSPDLRLQIEAFIQDVNVAVIAQSFLNNIVGKWEHYQTHGKMRELSLSLERQPDPGLRTPPVRTRKKPPSVVFSVNKNARVGEPYSAEILYTGSNVVTIERVECPAGLNLTFDSETGRLEGNPDTPGDHTLRIFYRFATSERNRPSLSGDLLVIVNPDPRSLWKVLPSDRSDLDWKPDAARQLMDAAHGRRMAAASKRGRSHEHVGSFRDDDCLVMVHDGWNILAVADGAGSAKKSRKGAALAVQVACSSLQSLLGGEEGRKLEEAAASNLGARTAAYAVLGAAAFRAFRAIETEAANKAVASKEYSTTLILGIHKQIPAGHLVAAYWVGDGAIAIYEKQTAVELLGESDVGEFAGQTRFLDHSMVTSGDEIYKRLRVQIKDDFTALMLMSDGVSDPKFETETSLSDLARWDALWGELEPMLATSEPDARLLDWLDFWSQGNHDDRTIAILW